MDKPEASEYRLDTRIDWASLGLPDPSPNPELVLQGEIDDAWAYVEMKTCRDLDALDESDSLGRLALRAVKLRTIQQAVQGTGGYLTGAINNLVKSFSVPGYSETKYDLQSLGSKFQHSQINDWPVLADLLWVLMTQECKDKLVALFFNENPPASEVTEIDWFYPTGMNLPGRYDPNAY